MRSFSLALLLVLVGSSHSQHEDSFGSIFDFAATVIGASLSHHSEKTPQVTLEYYYTGAKPMDDSSASFTFEILAPGCNGPALDDSAVFFNSFIETEADKVIASILIDSSTIESSPTFWNQSLEREEEATLQFCGKWTMYYEGNYVSFQETDFVATVSVTQNGFEVGALNGLDRADVNRIDRYSNVEFPSYVFFCNDTGLEIEPPPVINQGTPIDICVEGGLEQGNGAAVFVQWVEQMSYSATLASGEVTISLVHGGETVGPTAQMDCQSNFGICHIKFIADARLFLNSTDSENTLSISGLSVISFGDENINSAAQRGRRPWWTMRSLQQEDEDEDDTIQVSDFAFTIQHLNASASVTGGSTSSSGKATITFVTVGFSFVLGALAIFM